MHEVSKKNFICCILAMTLVFLGISVAMPTSDSVYLRTTSLESASNSSFYSVNNTIEEPLVCTLTMLNHGFNVIRGNLNGSMIRWQDRDILLFLVVGCFLQYLFYYQSFESKEDGQLFSCRSLIVDYIHMRDSGE